MLSFIKSPSLNNAVISRLALAIEHYRSFSHGDFNQSPRSHDNSSQLTEPDLRELKGASLAASLDFLQYYNERANSQKFPPIFHAWWNSLQPLLPNIGYWDLRRVMLELGRINKFTGGSLRHFLTRQHIDIFEEKLIRDSRFQKYCARWLFALETLRVPSDTYASTAFVPPAIVSAVVDNVAQKRHASIAEDIAVCFTYCTLVGTRALLTASDLGRITTSLLEKIKESHSLLSQCLCPNSDSQHRPYVSSHQYISSVYLLTASAFAFLVQKINPNDILSCSDDNSDNNDFWHHYFLLVKCVADICDAEMVEWSSCRIPHDKKDFPNLLSCLRTNCMRIACDFGCMPETLGVIQDLVQIVPPFSDNSMANDIVSQRAADAFLLKCRLTPNLASSHAKSLAAVKAYARNCLTAKWRRGSATEYDPLSDCLLLARSTNLYEAAQMSTLRLSLTHLQGCLNRDKRLY